MSILSDANKARQKLDYFTTLKQQARQTESDKSEF